MLRDNRAFVRFYFDRVYKNEDPYAIADDPLERQKRERSVAMLSGARYETALEIGGGEGLLAEMLADQVGAKTVHGAFIDDARMGVAGDDTHETYRITLLRGDGYGAA